MKYVLILIFFCACTSQREIMDSWLGSTKHQLLTEWGPPSQTSDDGDGGEILVFTSSTFYNNAVFYRNKIFYVGKDKKIYRWMVRTTQQPPTIVMFR
jgi:hypothetical protein